MQLESKNDAGKDVIPTLCPNLDVSQLLCLRTRVAFAEKYLDVCLEFGDSSVVIGERRTMKLLNLERFCPITTFNKRITATLTEASSPLHQKPSSLRSCKETRDLEVTETV